MNKLESVAIVGLVGAVGYLLGRGHDAPLHADGSVNSNRNMIAVTAPYQAGVSLLYLIDTETKQLAVYEARGGSKTSARLSFLAARRVDLDLRLEGYHDDSEYSFADLASQFRKSGWTDVRSGSNATSTPADKPEKAGEKGEKGPGEKSGPGGTPPKKDGG